MKVEPYIIRLIKKLLSIKVINKEIILLSITIQW